MPVGHQGEGERDQVAFRRFLLWLDEGVDSGGQKYVEMHQRLVAYFDRKNCLSPDALADETLSRAARRLEEEGTIAGPPAHYCYIVARFVFLEHQRQAKPTPADLSELPQPAPASDQSETLSCLEQCLRKLEKNDRALILEYYRGERRAKIERRRTLAQRLGLSMNAVSIRACRIRERLEICVRGCSGAKITDAFSGFRLN